MTFKMDINILTKYHETLCMFYYVFFCGYIPNKNSPNPIDKLNRKLAIAFRYLWDIISVFFVIMYIVLVINPERNVHYLHLFDMSSFALLRWVLRQRINKLIEFIRELKCLNYSLKIDGKYNTFILIIRILLFSLLLTLLVDLFCFVTAESFVFNQFLARYTMSRFTDVSQTKFPIFSKFCIISMTFLLLVHQYTTIGISLVICCEVQIISSCVFYQLRHSFKNVLKSNKISKTDLIKMTCKFWKTSKVVKRTNDSVSPIAFLLIVFYAFDIVYTLSRTADQHMYLTIYHVSSLGRIIQFFIHFILLVISSSNFDAELLKYQKMISRVNSDDPAQVLLSISLLEACRNETVLKPLGALKLEKSLILAFIGAIVSYEVMVLPYLK